MTEADTIRLRQAARLYEKFSGWPADDLIQEVYVRALDDVRRCPVDVPVTLFLCNAMRSIAYSARAAGSSPRLQVALDMTGTDGVAATLEAAGRNPEQRVLAREDYAGRVAALEALFGGDEEAQMLIEADMEGFKGAEICELLDWDALRLATVRRRVRNTMARRFPRGWPA